MSHVFRRQPKQAYPVAVRGEGIEIIDRDGKRYLDASGGAAVSCLGHSHPRVIEAIQAQAAGACTTAASSRTSRRSPRRFLIERAGGHRSGILYVRRRRGGRSGAEDGAPVLRRDRPAAAAAFHRAAAGLHGNTLGALAVGGNAWRRRQFEPLIDVAHVSPCYAYRDQAPNEPDEAYVALAAELEATIQDSVRVGDRLRRRAGGRRDHGRGAAGARLLPRRAICDRYGMLLILDEVMCGMGAPGTLFPLSRKAVRPDLVTIAKGLGAGYQAIGATLVARAIYDSWPARASSSTATPTPHPTACAAGLAVQQAIVEEQLLGRVREQGARLREPARALRRPRSRRRHPGKGLFIELVADRTSNSRSRRSAGCMPACGRRPWRAA